MQRTLRQLMALGCLLASGCFMHHPLDPPEDTVDPSVGAPAAGEDDGTSAGDDPALDDAEDEQESDEGFGFPEPDPDEGFGLPEPDPEEDEEGTDCDDPANDFEAWLCELEEGEDDDPFGPPDDEDPFTPPDNPFLPGDDPAEDDPLAEVCEDPGFFAQLICGLFGGEGGGFGNPAPEPEPEPEPDDGELDCSRDDLTAFEQFLCDLQGA